MVAVRSPVGRAAQRLETRERLFSAAIDEFARAGMGAADVGAVVRVARVARGTFYFHFPTKAHVLVELAERESIRLSDELARFVGQPHDLRGALGALGRLVVDIEQRLGPVLFRDLMSLYFSPPDPIAAGWDRNRVIALVTEELERGRAAGDIDPGTDVSEAAFFLLVGLYAVLTSRHVHALADRAEVVDRFLITMLVGLEPR